MQIQPDPGSAAPTGILLGIATGVSKSFFNAVWNSWPNRNAVNPDYNQVDNVVPTRAQHLTWIRKNNLDPRALLKTILLIFRELSYWSKRITGIIRIGFFSGMIAFHQLKPENSFFLQVLYNKMIFISRNYIQNSIQYCSYWHALPVSSSWDQ